MNKKGFTLVEIIVCVAIISVIGVVIGLNSEKIFKKEEVEPAPTKIETAASTYAEGNKKLVEDLYNEKSNFINLSVGELIDNGLIDESVVGESYENSAGDNDTITRDTNIVVTLDAYGNLKFDVGSETKYGYLRADDIVIAAGDPYGCEYSIGEKELKSDGSENKGSKLMFIDKDGDRIKAKGYDSECDIDDSECMKEVTKEELIVNDYQYWCNIESKRNSENNLDPSTTYEITYVYKIEGLKSRKTRTVIVKEPLAIDLKKENFNISTNNQNDFKLYDEGVDSDGIKNYKIYYNTNNSTNVYFTLNNIPTNYTDGGIQFAYKINNSAKKTLQNIISDGIQLEKGTPQKTHTIEVYPIYKKANEYSESQIQNDLITTHVTPSTKVKLQISDAPITINSVVYKDSSNKTVTAEESNQGKKVIVNATSTLGITKIEYKLDSDTSWKELNSDTLITDPSINIQIQVTNEVGEIKEGTYKFNVVKPITNFKDNNCTTVSNKSGCYYKGSQTNNYVKFGGRDWRIYKIVDNSLYLILDSNYSKTGYGQIGKCTSDCCNNGRYYYQHLGSTRTTNKAGTYGFKYKTLNYVLDELYTSISNVDDETLLTSISQKVNTKSFSRINGISLLEKADYSIIASCSGNSCSNKNYIKDKKDAFWLLESGTSVDTGAGTFTYGYLGASTTNYIVNSSGNIASVTASSSPTGETSITTKTYDTRPIAKIVSTAKIISGNGTEIKPYILGK